MRKCYNSWNISIKKQYFSAKHFMQNWSEKFGWKAAEKIWVKECNVTEQAAKTPLNSGISAVSVPRETERRLPDFPRETYKNGYFYRFCVSRNTFWKDHVSHGLTAAFVVLFSWNICSPFPSVCVVECNLFATAPMAMLLKAAPLRALRFSLARPY